MLKILYYLAVIATAIAAWIGFYFGYVKPKSPFEPKVTFGSPVLKEVDGQVSITLGVLVSNVGGHPGCLADMAMSVQSEASKTRWAFMPTWFIDMRSYLRGLPEKQDIISSVNGTFSPLSLPANAMQSYSVFFMPRAIEDPKLEPLRSHNLIPGDTYELALYIISTKEDCKISEHNEWVLAGKAKFVLQQEHLKAFKAGLAVIPLDIERDVLRHKFIRR